MLETLQSIDLAILLFFNDTLGCEFLDRFFSALTNLHKLSWFRFGVALPLAVYFAYRHRMRFLKILLAVGLVVAVTDSLNYRWIKPSFQRVRPNLDPQVKSVKLRLNFHPRGYSFPSNHAFNTFAMAGTLSWFFPVYRWAFLGFAALVALSRVYLGVHYPFDVTVGGLCGLLVAALITRLLYRRWHWMEGARSAD